MAAGIASLEHDDYNMENCQTIAETRDWAAKELEKLRFDVTPSKANFLFARHPKVSGEELYRKLKERGILIRHFNVERIRDYNRISVGTREQMEKLIETTGKILGK